MKNDFANQKLKRWKIERKRNWI